MNPAWGMSVPFWCFYIHQGMVTALIARGAGAYFRQQGWSLAALSYLSLAMLPWALKGLWAATAERHAVGLRGNRYLGSLAMLQLAMAAVMLVTGHLTPASTPAYAVYVVVALLALATISATHDIFADGIVIGTTKPAARPVASMAQVGGSYIGYMACPPLFLAVAQASGWTTALAALSMLSLLLLLPPLRLCQPLSGRPHRRALPPPASSTSRHGTLRALWPALCLAGIAYPAMRAMMALEAPLLIDLGLSLQETGAVLALFASGGSALGIVAGGWMVRRLPSGAALQWICVCHITIPAIGFVLYPMLGVAGWQVLIVLGNLAAAAGFVVVYRVLMDLVRPARPAADYALFQSIDAAVAVCMSLGALQLANLTGYRCVLALLAVLAVASCLAIFRLIPHLACAATPAAAVLSETHPDEIRGA